MAHLFILFPLLIILSGVMIQLYRKQRERSLWYFRNFFVLWSLCTVAIGLAEVFFHGNSYARSMALAFAVPFLYVASAFLVKLPFVMYEKEGTPSQILAAVVIIAGILFGMTTFFSANKMIGELGIFSDFFAHLSKNLTQYRIWTTLAIFVPIGVFFYVEAARGRVFQSRVRSVLIGSGLIVAGIAEYFHIVAKHAAGADIYTVLGFFLVVFGLLLPFFWKSSLPQAP